MKWILALCLALLPLSANAITLRPVDWTSAGFMPGPFGLAEAQVFCSQIGCGIGAPVPITAPDFSIDLGGVLQVSVEFVSEVVGNRWTYGYRNLSVVADPSVPTWNATFYLDVSAALTVPDGPGLSTLALVSGGLPQDLLFDSTLGAGTTSTGLPVDFLPADQVDVFHGLEVDIALGRNPQSTGTFSTCGRSTTVLSDCLVTVDLFEVVPSVPEPSAPILLMAGVGSFGMLRRRRAANG